uniref:Uncharacterized protein n=1 Tax=Molossus molossus TaxID=27622 RepID=A0A7J8F8U4_MOLMO|nr:hypothetical protein HJG59_008463 [Molossus molossus]
MGDNIPHVVGMSFQECRAWHAAGDVCLGTPRRRPLPADARGARLLEGAAPPPDPSRGAACPTPAPQLHCPRRSLPLPHGTDCNTQSAKARSTQSFLGVLSPPRGLSAWPGLPAPRSRIPIPTPSGHAAPRRRAGKRADSQAPCAAAAQGSSPGRRRNPSTLCSPARSPNSPVQQGTFRSLHPQVSVTRFTRHQMRLVVCMFNVSIYAETHGFCCGFILHTLACCTRRWFFFPPSPVFLLSAAGVPSQGLLCPHQLTTDLHKCTFVCL